MPGLIKKSKQTDRVLEALRYAKANNTGWVGGQYFLHTMLLSQYHARIKELEEKGCVIEHSTFKDEFGYKSYRLISEPGSSTTLADRPISIKAQQFLNQWKKEPEKKVIDLFTFAK